MKRDQVVCLSSDKETSYPLEERPVDRYPKGGQVVSSSSETETGCPPEERPVDRYPRKMGNQVGSLSSEKEAGFPLEERKGPVNEGVYRRHDPGTKGIRKPGVGLSSGRETGCPFEEK